MRSGALAAHDVSKLRKSQQRQARSCAQRSHYLLAECLDSPLDTFVVGRRGSWFPAKLADGPGVGNAHRRGEEIGPIRGNQSHCPTREREGPRSVRLLRKLREEVSYPHRFVIDNVIGLPWPATFERGNDGGSSILDIDPGHDRASTIGQG